MTGLQHMTVPIEWKADDKDPSVLTGYASTFGNVDLGGDVVMPGAFAKTVAYLKAGNTIPFLADHIAATSHLLGSIFDADEDRNGLKIKVRLSKAPSVVDVTTKMKEGHLNRMSIGYETMEEKFEDRDGARVRLLVEVKLWETSAVVFPMNPEAVIQGVKTIMEGAVAAGVEPALIVTEAETKGVSLMGVKIKRRDPADGDMSLMDLWRTDLAVEAKTGVPSETTPAAPAEQQKGEPGPADPGSTGSGATAVPDDESGRSPDETGDKGGRWDQWRSQAMLDGRDTGDVDPATRAALRTRLELAESQSD